jgi:A/G-specific adenine glycosylase
MAFASNLQNSIPVPINKKPLPHKQVTAGIIRSKRGRLLITQRPLNGLLGGLWKFPGGEQIKGLTVESSLEKNIQHELGIEVTVKNKLAIARHQYTHFRITLHLFFCIRRHGAPKSLGCNKWRWVNHQDFDDFAFSRAEHKVMHYIN